MLKLLLFLILFVLCWPLALLAWLLSIPFRLLGIVTEGVFGLLRAIVLLPVRILEGGRRP